MSSQTVDEQVPAAAGQVGVLATWRGMPRQVKALLAGLFVNKLAGFLQIFLVLFLTSRGYSAGQAGLALGLYGAGAVIGTFVGGSLSDRQSARTAMLTSMLGSAVLLASIVYLHNYLLIVLAVILVAAVSQVYRPAAQAMITELTPADRLVMVTAIYRLCLNLGTSAAPLLGVALVSVSYNLLFWGEALAALTYGLIALFFLPRSRPRPAAAAGDGQPATGQPAPAAETAKDGLGYRALLRDHKYLLYLLGFLLMHLVYTQYTTTLPLAVKAAGVNIWWYGAVISVNGAVIVACEVWVTKFVQHWPLRRALLCGYGLLAAGYGVYAIGVTPVLLMFGTLLWTVSEILGAPTVWSYPGRVAPARLRGRYFGALHSTASLGSTLGPILGVLVYVHVGQRVFLWAALVGVLATVVGRIGMRTPAAVQRVEPDADPVLVEPVSTGTLLPGNLVPEDLVPEDLVPAPVIPEPTG
ncbi:MAG: MFS transporter [Jatrophihabitantaceae bacterium]